MISIFSNHGAIVTSYLCWLLWPLMAEYKVEGGTSPQTPFSSPSKGLLFLFILLMDVFHDLGAVGNSLALQRDWVPVLVDPGMIAAL